VIYNSREKLDVLSKSDRDRLVRESVTYDDGLKNSSYFTSGRLFEILLGLSIGRLKTGNTVERKY
jgi:hypothetical protein